MKIDPDYHNELDDQEKALLEDALSGILTHNRTTKLIVIEGPGDGDGKAGETRYGGKPWMGADQAWPEYDGEPMTFAAQVDLADLPGSEASGTLLVFIAEGEYKKGKTGLAVLAGAKPSLRDDGPFDTHLRVSLHEHLDYPHGEDLDEMLFSEGVEAMSSGLWEGVVRSSTSHEEIDDATGLEVKTLDIVRNGLKPRAPCFTTDKIGGWPAWLQMSEVPETASGEKIILVAQLNDMGRIGECTNLDHALWGSAYVFASRAMDEFFVVQQAD